MSELFKYEEDVFMEQVKEYIESTYSAHYTSTRDNIQVNDLIMAIGHGEGSYIANAIEYLARYGKKDGKNQKDLLKAIHNILLLMYLNHRVTFDLDVEDFLKTREVGADCRDPFWDNCFSPAFSSKKVVPEVETQDNPNDFDEERWEHFANPRNAEWDMPQNFGEV